MLATISLSVFCVYNAEYPFGKRAYAHKDQHGTGVLHLTRAGYKCR